MTELAALDFPRFDAPALCAETDADAFYPEKGGSASAAKSVCGRCGALQECLTYALDRGLTSAWDGVWGGTTPRERRELLKARGQRPTDATTTQKRLRTARIRELIARGLTPTQVAAQMGLPMHTVYMASRCTAAPTPPVVVAPPNPKPTHREWATDELAAAVQELAHHGFRRAEIARELGVTVGAVRRAVA